LSAVWSGPVWSVCLVGCVVCCLSASLSWLFLFYLSLVGWCGLECGLSVWLFGGLGWAGWLPVWLFGGLGVWLVACLTVWWSWCGFGWTDWLFLATVSGLLFWWCLLLFAGWVTTVWLFGGLGVVLVALTGCSWLLCLACWFGVSCCCFLGGLRPAVVCWFGGVGCWFWLLVG